jgi:hypothetical protein
VRTTCQSVVTDYRVFMLTQPKFNLTVAGDVALAASTKLDDAVARLQAAADRQAAAGKDVTAARAQIDLAAGDSATARTKATGAADPVLALQPADLPAKKDVVDQERATLKDVRTTLKAGVAAAHQAASLLRG